MHLFNALSWSISAHLHNFIGATLPMGSTILELGSGRGTALLASHYGMHSVEHDLRFVGLYDSSYIHAPIRNGWYDTDVLRGELPDRYDLILVDGPPGKIGR